MAETIAVLVVKGLDDKGSRINCHHRKGVHGKNSTFEAILKNNINKDTMAKASLQGKGNSPFQTPPCSSAV